MSTMLQESDNAIQEKWKTCLAVQCQKLIKHRVEPGAVVDKHVPMCLCRAVYVRAQTFYIPTLIKPSLSLTIALVFYVRIEVLQSKSFIV